MLEKKINSFMLDEFSNEIQDIYQDLLTHPDSEYREDELDYLVDKIYKEGFSDGIKFMEWLNCN